MESARILIADDEREIRALLARYLEREGYTVDEAPSGGEALRLLGARAYDLVILDIMMPEADGFEVCETIRRTHAMPILFLSAKDAESDKISGLMLGADDYVTKPFSVNELVARVRAHLRRNRLAQGKTSGPSIQSSSRCGITIDQARHEARKGDKLLTLPPKEFDLLALFLSHPGQVFTKSQLFCTVWGDFAVEDENTVTVHIRRLRTKIEADPSTPILIRTIHGIGYSFADA